MKLFLQIARYLGHICGAIRKPRNRSVESRVLNGLVKRISCARVSLDKSLPLADGLIGCQKICAALVDSQRRGIGSFIDVAHGILRVVEHLIYLTVEHWSALFFMPGNAPESICCETHAPGRAVCVFQESTATVDCIERAVHFVFRIDGAQGNLGDPVKRQTAYSCKRKRPGQGQGDTRKCQNTFHAQLPHTAAIPLLIVR